MPILLLQMQLCIYVFLSLVIMGIWDDRPLFGSIDWMLDVPRDIVRWWLEKFSFSSSEKSF